MSQLLGLLSPIGLGGGKPRTADDDLMDQVNHTYTVMVLILLSVIVSTKQYVGDPINCWVPGHFTGNHETFANQACWVSNTYYLPDDTRIPERGSPKPKDYINYYQWIPMILLVQAALFYVPVLIWRGLNGKIGVQIVHIVDAGRLLHDPDKRAKSMAYMVRQMDRYLGHYREDHQRGCLGRIKAALARRGHLMCGKKYGNFLAVLYLGVKLLYLANSLGQLFLMDAFLGTDFHLYGFRALRALSSGAEWPGSRRFPTFTLCDYTVRQMGHNIHRNTVQCVLPINFFNEKLYLALWFWMFAISVMTGLSVLSWFTKTVFGRDRYRFIKRHLRALGRYDSSKKKQVKRFVQEYLRSDGVTIIRLVQLNTSDIVASELTTELFDAYMKNPPPSFKKDRLKDSTDDPA